MEVIKQLVDKNIINFVTNEGENPKDYIIIKQGEKEEEKTAQFYANLQSNLNKESSWHWQVDDKNIIQSFEHSKITKFTKEKENNSAINILLSINQGINYINAIDNISKLVAVICTDENISTSNIKFVGTWTNKDSITKDDIIEKIDNYIKNPSQNDFQEQEVLYSTTDIDIQSYIKQGILKVNDTIEKDTKKIQIGNIIETLKNILIKKLNINEDEFEPQLLTLEFSEVKLYDYYGNSYIYNPQYFRNTDISLLISSTIGNTNVIHYTLNNYLDIEYTILKPLNPKLYIKKDNIYNYGFFDKTTRSVPIVSSSSDSFFQMNKNAIEGQIESFKENKNLIEQNIGLNYEKTDLSNKQAMGNLEYQRNSLNLNTGVSLASSLMSLPFSPISSIFSAGTSLATYKASSDNLSRLTENQKELNNLNLQGVSLSALQSKTQYNQALRAFNAKLKDLKNQPDTVSNISNDTFFQMTYNIDDVNIEISTADDMLLQNAYNYLKLYGVIQNKYYKNISNIFNYRENYNYIKMSSIEIKENDIPQKDLNMIKAIFISGVRVWNYKEGIDFKNYTIENKDK